MNTPLLNGNSSPEAFYTDRLQACQHETAHLQRRHVLLGYLRLLWAVAVLALGYLSFARHELSWIWLLVPCAAFALTARWHAVVLASHARSRRAGLFYQHGLARVQDRWAGFHPRATPVDTSASLYAADLDLFGPGSVFELLCTARTTLGERTLAQWLLQPAPAADVLARQASVADLREHTALREAFAAAPGPDLLNIDPDALTSWGEAEATGIPNPLRWFAPFLVVLTIAATVRWALVQSPLSLIPILLINACVTMLLQRRTKPLFAETEQASQRLGILAELLERVEQETFTAARLKALQGGLHTGAQPASQAIRRLATLAAGVEHRTNYVVRILDIPLLYSVQLGLMIQGWRRTHGANLRQWLAILGDVEALLSLAAYHFEHPADPFPEVGTEETVFAAESLGHPLLPEAGCVRNSITLDTRTRLWLISGSNMSGKSTLLRAVGVAAVLAMAGAPVRARRLRIGPLQVAASIQINDSLQSGRSHFYAEILRLRAICELARTHRPVLFLLDELLAGTNSHDRLAGAEGVVKNLLAAGALGLLSTHDLALTGIAGPAAGLIRNAHFEDNVVDNKLEFDYTLREGVVERSNGVALMRLIGLDV